MRKKITSLLGAYVALLLSSTAGAATTASYSAIINETPVWSVAASGGPSNGSHSRSMAVSGGSIYTFDYSASKIWYVNTSTQAWKSFSFTSTTAMMASDDAGNLVIPQGQSSFGDGLNAQLKFAVLPAGATSTSGVKYLTVPKQDSSGATNAGRNDYISAAGNFLGTGGYVYMYPSAGTFAHKVVRLGGKADASGGTGLEVKSFACAANDQTTSLAKSVRESNATKILVQTGGQRGATTNNGKAYLYEVSGDSLAMLASEPYKTTFMSGTVAKRNDKEYYVYADCDKGSLNWSVLNAKFTVQDVATGEKSTFTLPGVNKWYCYSGVKDSSGNKPTDGVAISVYAGMWVDAAFVNDSTIAVYCYVPQQTARRYDVSIVKRAVLPGNISLSRRGEVQDAVLTWDAYDGAATYQVVKISGSTQTVIAKELTELTYTYQNLESESTFQVQAINGTGAILAQTELLTATPEFVAHEPEWEALREYDGYAKTQLLWGYTYGRRPSAYDIYRDGQLVAKDIVVMNYIDRDVPEGSHTYKIASVYYVTDDEGNVTRRSETAFSSERTCYVTARNPLKESYGIIEEYNYEFHDSDVFSSNTALPSFTDQDVYRQGVLYNGKWYIAQRNDASGKTGKGGIVCIDADAASVEAMAATGKKIYSCAPYSNVGIAVDGKGNFFIRHDENTTNSAYNFATGLKTGKLVTFSDDQSSYTERTVDLSGISLPRTDYYSMSDGDAAGGSAKLYLSPTNTNVGWSIDLNAGAVSDTVRLRTGSATVGSENFIFPLEGRSDLVVGLRSSGYYNIDPATPTVSNPIYNTLSRIQNAGGISLWFNNDLIVVTPQSPWSKNPGDFLVAKGTPDPDKYVAGTQKNASAADVQVGNGLMIPLASVSQNVITSLPTDNSNGIWFGAVPHDESGNKYISLYLYVPGIRFAKYRIYPQVNFPEASLEMDVAVQYATDSVGKNTDITSIKGTATWPVLDLSESDYSVKEYILEFVDNDDRVISEHKFTDADAVEGKFTCSLGSLYNAHDYTARLSVSYYSALDPDWTMTSSPVTASDKADYDVVNPSGEVTVYPSSTFSTTEEGVSFRSYRCDIDINSPASDAEPVTYYELWCSKAGVDSVKYRLTNFSILNAGVKAVQHQDVLPGTYDFGNKATNFEDGKNVVVCYYHQPEVDGVSGELLDANEDPSTWKFYVVAKYAACAERISKQTVGEITPSLGGTTGAADLVDVTVAEEVTPAITTGPVTIKATEAIAAVNVYSTDGMLVMSLDGNGETLMKADLSSLAGGMYLVSVNGHGAHKVVKR